MDEVKDVSHYKLNLKRAKKDARDLKYSSIMKRELAEPAVVDLSSKTVPVFDQGQQGSCTGNAWASQIADLQNLNGKYAGPLSRQFIYNCERIADGDLSQDGGSNMREGGDVLINLGVCGEKFFPYGGKNLYKKPPKTAYAEALKHKGGAYYAVDTVAQMRACLQAGFGFVFGFDVPTGFMGDEMARSGKMQASLWDKAQSEGGHAVYCVGYDDTVQMWKVKNSWGADWGLKGFFYMPYDYMVADHSVYDHYTARLANQKCAE